MQLSPWLVTGSPQPLFCISRSVSPHSRTDGQENHSGLIRPLSKIASLQTSKKTGTRRNKKLENTAVGEVCTCKLRQGDRLKKAVTTRNNQEMPSTPRKWYYGSACLTIRCLHCSVPTRVFGISNVGIEPASSFNNSDESGLQGTNCTR